MNKISLSLLPVSLAASTYSSFFIFKTILLESLAYLGQVTEEIAIIAFVILGPKSPAIAIASIIPGKDTIISASLIIIVSTIPPKYPANRPKVVPRVKTVPTRANVIKSEYLVP